MRKKALTKEFFVSIKKTYNRFISICLIVMLGTSFFAGVKATEPDMQESADIFFDESSLMDIRVLSTLGLTDEDVAAIAAIDGVKDVSPTYTYDVLAEKDDTQHVLKLMAVSEDVNKITVTEGRMPEKSGECLVDSLLVRNGVYEIGDQITVYSGDDEAIEDIVGVDTFTIVGVGKTSYYLDLTRDSSTIGNGSMSGFIVIPGEDFSVSAYTEIDVTVAGAAKLDCYGDAYQDKIDEITDRIEAIADGQCEIRYAKVVDDANEAIADAQAEVDDSEKELTDAANELADGKQQLEDAKVELADGKQQLEDAKVELADGKRQLEDAKVELANGWQEIYDAEAKLSDGKAQLAEAKTTLADSENQLNASKAQLNDGLSQLTSAKQQISDGETVLAQYEAQAAEGKTALDAASAQLEDLQAQLDTLKSGIDQMKEALDAAQAEYDMNASQLKSARETLEGQRPQIDSLRNQKTQLEAAVAQTQTQMSELPQESEAWKTLNAQLAAQTEALAQVTAGIDAFDKSDSSLSQSEAELAAAKAQLDEQWSQYETMVSTYEHGQAQLEAGRQTYEESLSQYEAGQQELTARRQTLETSKQTIASKEAELNAGQVQIAEGEAKLASGKETIAQSEASLLAAENEISSGRQKLIDGEKEIVQNEETIADGEKEIAENEQKLADGEKEIEENEKKLSDAQAEYDEAYEENYPKLVDAKEEIAQAKLDVEAISMPEWYVLDRNYMTTCVAYAQDSERIGKIGNVFPVIFFLVAALVSLTTMTRMVEEERVQIGTLKALGYSKASIAAKYVLYAFLATIIGGVIGTLAGQIIFPSVIMNAYEISYVTLTNFVTPMHLNYSLISLIAAVFSTTIATVAACYKELLAAPAELMRPASPKIGKRVLMERITFIWKRLNFSAKASVRNLFRYKKRLFMTILGIGACMGLLLVGFGVKDSIMTIGDRQYNSIHIYQAELTLADDCTDEEAQSLLDTVSAESTTKQAMPVHESTIDTCADGTGEGERSTYLLVPKDVSSFDQFIVLQDRTTGEKYELDDDGVIISEKLATLLDLAEGDQIYLEVSDMNYQPVTVSHVVENYFYHYVYMTPSLYEKIYGEAVDYSEIYVVNQDPTDTDYENSFSETYLSMDSVAGITFTRTISDRIESMITSMNVVIYVLVVSAGLLAFVVLYNLNNINISERQRELATLKVLGFYDGEVSMYVFRENIMLTILGTIFGIFFGIWLHRFVILTAELDIMMFGRQIYLRSFIYSIVLTLAFSLIVNVAMHRKMKKIDMIESLKSVE